MGLFFTMGLIKSAPGRSILYYSCTMTLYSKTDFALGYIEMQYKTQTQT